MARRIVWSSKAEMILQSILLFYFLRNGNKKYSKKLHQEILNRINLLAKNPFLGKKTTYENVRILIKGNYKISYLILETEIVVLMVWDSRQNNSAFALNPF